MGLGTKADNLIRMRELDFNVPEFTCISADIYLEHIDLNVIKQIYQQIDFNNEASLSTGSNQIEDYLLDNLPQIEVDIDHQSHSVRSSTNLEDSSSLSFAGQFSTFLNVKADDVTESIRKCIATMYNPSALIYMAKNDLDINVLKMNVIVQKMIDAECSGIIFSANPQGLLNEVVVVTGAGTGDNVVEDKVDVTTYFYNKIDETIYNVTQGSSVLLSSEVLEQLLEITAKLETHFGPYIDIEFCIKDQSIYILQVREITSLSDDNITIYDNSNIVESYPGVCSPFTVDFATYAYTKVFTGLIADFLNVPQEQITHLTSQMVASNNGRMYYVISNWYQLLVLLPFSKKIIPLWQEMLGVKNKSYPKPAYKLSSGRKIIRNFKFVQLLSKSNKLMKKLNNDFNEVSSYFHDTYSPSLTNQELIVIYKNIDKLLSTWYVTLINDMYAFIYTGLLKAYLKKLNVADYDVVCNELIRNNDTLESMLPIIEVKRIVDYVNANNLLEELQSLTVENTKDYLLENDTELKQLINNYISIYGDRYLAELKIENETFRSNNYLFIATLINYCKNPFEINQDNQSPEINTNFISKKIIKFLQKRAIIGIEHRETSRLNRSRIFGMVRTIANTIGDNFEREGLLETASDIFYLTPDEIQDNNIDQQVIAERKSQNASYELLPHYSRLEFSGEPFNKNHLNINGMPLKFDEHNLHGIPSSRGIVRGEVAVITSLDNLSDIDFGKILVTKMTDPGWVFLLTSSIAVISEKGSLLSHTAIISRELGIPAIVGVENITRILKSGDIIEMDGGTGTIKIISKGDSNV